MALRFELPGVPRPLAAEGRVMWSADSQAGIRFLRLPPEDGALLGGFLRAREGSPADGGQPRAPVAPADRHGEPP